MATLAEKARITVNSVVSWAVFATVVLTAVMSEVQDADWFPESWAGEVLKWGAILVGALGAAIRVLKKVTPVPEEGLQVVLEDGTTADVVRGWE